jgi:putative ABC transport system permease protein
MSIYFTIAFRNLLQAKRRTLLLGTAIAMVTFLQVLLQSVGNGYMENLEEGTTALTSGHINVLGLYKMRQGQMTPFMRDADAVVDLIKEAAPEEIDKVYLRNGGPGRLIGDFNSRVSLVQGIDYEAEEGLQKTLLLAPESSYVEGGREETFGDVSKVTDLNSIVLFSSQAKTLGVKVGDEIAFRAFSLTGVNVTNMRVVAVVEDVGAVSSFFVFMSRDTVAAAMNISEDVSGNILVYLKDKQNSQAVMQNIRETLRANNYSLTDYEGLSIIKRWGTVERQPWLGQKIDTVTWQDNVKDAELVVKSIDAISFVLLTILSIIIGIGIVNTCWISVQERANEIGCIRAIGMSSRAVLGLFMLESLMLGVLFSSLGAMIAWIVITFVSSAEIPIHSQALSLVLFTNKLNLSIFWSDMLIAIAIFSTITGVAALFPALRASQIEPIQAINAAH